MINEACQTTGKTKNTGGKKQCLEAPAQTKFLAKDSFSFPDMATAKTEDAWIDAITSKDVVPFPDIEGIEANDTEATIKTGRYRDYQTKRGVQGSSYRYDLSVCTYESVLSYEDSEYTRVFVVSSENEISCDVQDDGSVKGRDLTSYFVGLRKEPTDGDVPYCMINLKYRSDLFDILKADFDIKSTEGVFDVDLEQVSATATVVRFTIKTSCQGTNVSTAIGSAGATQSNNPFIIEDADGDVQPQGAATYSDGVYEITGAWSEGMTLRLNGVRKSTEIIFEGTGKMNIIPAE